MIFIKEESCIKYQYLVWTSHQPPTIGKGRGQYGPLLCIKGRENWTSVSIWSLSCVVWSVFLNSPIHPLIFCSLLYDSFGIFYLLHTIFSSPHLDYMFHEGKGHAWFNPFWVTQVLALCPGHYRCSVNICGCNEWINQWTDERMNENQTWIFSSPTAESGSCLCSAENLTPSTEILPDCQPCDRQKGGADPGRSRTTPWRRQGHGTGSRCSWRAIWTPTPIHLRQSDQVPVGGGELQVPAQEGLSHNFLLPAQLSLFTQQSRLVQRGHSPSPPPAPCVHNLSLPCLTEFLKGSIFLFTLAVDSNQR